MRIEGSPICGFHAAFETSGTPVNSSVAHGVDVLGAGPSKKPVKTAGRPPFRPAAAGGKKDPVAIVQAARSAVVNAANAGKAAVVASKATPKMPASKTAIKGAEARDHILGHAMLAGRSTVAILGATVSALTSGLAAKAAASHAALSAAKSLAATAPTKKARAAAALTTVQRSVNAHAGAAGAAGQRGQQALATAQQTAKVVKEQSAKVEKLLRHKIAGVVVGDAASDHFYNVNVPGDALRYDGQKGFPAGMFGSYNFFYGPQDAEGGTDGFIWTFQRGQIFGAHDAVFWYARRGGHWDDIQAKDANGANGANANTMAAAGVLSATSQKYGWGSLIGKPGSDFDGLHCAVDGTWYWLAGAAPSWATAELDAATTLLQTQTEAANQAAAAAAAAADDQLHAQHDAEQAAIEYQNAKDEAAIAEAASLQAAKLQMEDDANQAALAKQQAIDDQKQAQQDAAYSAQLDRLDLQNQQQVLDWAKAHPDQAYAQPQPPQGDDGMGLPDFGASDGSQDGPDDSELDQAFASASDNGGF